ncbi:MAG TPA: hypothetical protein VG265_04560 [Gaiellaceae bacterium]|nr:hypothetical protein [Gaiellaceae bacterium]
MRRFPAAALIGLVAAVSLTAASSAARVTWDEKAKDGKVAVMRFQIETFTFGKNAWSAHVTISNLSKQTIRVGNNFGAAIFGDSKTEDLRNEIGFAVASTFKPARPQVLKPGASWTGTIGGEGQLQPSGSTRWARIVLGPLEGLPGQSGAVWWVTDHALTVPPKGSSGPVI